MLTFSWSWIDDDVFSWTRVTTVAMRFCCWVMEMALIWLALFWCSTNTDLWNWFRDPLVEPFTFFASLHTVQKMTDFRSFQCQRRLRVCATKNLIQALLYSFSFCRLKVGGLMVFSAVFALLFLLSLKSWWFDGFLSWFCTPFPSVTLKLVVWWFSQPFQWFLRLRRTMIQTIRSTLGEERPTAWFVAPH